MVAIWRWLYLLAAFARKPLSFISLTTRCRLAFFLNPSGVSGCAGSLFFILKDTFIFSQQLLVGLILVRKWSIFPVVVPTAWNRSKTSHRAHGKRKFVTLNHGVLHLGIIAKYAASFFNNVTSSSRQEFSRLRLDSFPCWSFCSSKDCPI